MQEREYEVSTLSSYHCLKRWEKENLFVIASNLFKISLLTENEEIINKEDNSLFSPRGVAHVRKSVLNFFY